MILSLIVAMTQDRVIGRDNQLPWHLPADLRLFKRFTLGKPIIMGRKTHESIGRALPKRTNVVITRQPDYAAPGCLIAHSLAQALEMAEPAEEVVLIGGATLYQQVLPRAQRIYLTLVQAQVGGDTWFPALDWREWREVYQEEHAPDSRNAHGFRFLILERQTAPRSSTAAAGP